MSDRPGENVDRLHELLADRALQGLAAAEHSELARLLVDHPDADAAGLDRAAAALDLALGIGPDDPLPAALAERLNASAVEWMADARSVRPRRPAVVLPAPPGPGPAVTPPAPIRGVQFGWAPWLVAAACLFLAASLWTARPGTAPGTPEDLLAADPATRSVAWAGNDLGVEGDVVWSDARQEGFLRLRGLPVNDPTAIQYQLWIFDRRRGTKFNAVDGGVFDVDRAAGEVIVPIDAKLDVFEPVLFAVTTEPPGGVVKHDPELDPERYAIVLTAPVE